MYKYIFICTFTSLNTSKAHHDIFVKLLSSIMDEYEVCIKSEIGQVEYDIFFKNKKLTNMKIKTNLFPEKKTDI